MGYGKHDALNSPFLQFMSFNNKWLRILYIQFINRCPINLRKLVGVKISRDPKGITLFIRIYLFLF